MLQIWCDPHFREAWRDPALLAFIDGQLGFGALIRYGPAEGKAVFPPSLTGRGWVEKDTSMAQDEEHSPADVARVLSETTGDVYAVMHRDTIP